MLVEKKQKHKIIISFCSLLAITYIAFSPSLNNGFTNWDDEIYVVNNLKIRNLSWNNIKNIFTGICESHYQPLTLFSYTIEYKFFKLDPYYYHLTNLILHLLNTSLVFWLIFLVSDNIIISFITSILFGIHPLHVESVAWITERKDVLSTFFFLCTFICFIYYKNKGLPRYYYISVFLFVMSLLAKVMTITLPLVLFLYDCHSYRKFNRRTIIEKLPFFGIGAIFGVVAFLGHYLTKSIVEGQLFKLSDNILTACYGILFYISKMVMPVKLSCLYPQYEMLHGWARFVFKNSIYIIITLISLISILKIRRRDINFGILFFLIAVLPVIQIVPIGYGVPADRYTYIPSIGFFYIAAIIYSGLLKKSNYHKKLQVFFIILLTGMLGTLCILTRQQCKVWKDSFSLWGNAIQNYHNIPAAYTIRGLAFQNNKNYEQAIADFNKAIDLDSNYKLAYVNRGFVYDLMGEYAQAIADYNKALAIKPDYARAYLSRGKTWVNKGNYNQAIADYKRAININPEDAMPYYNLGNAYIKKGNYDKGIFEFTQAISLNPNYAAAYNNRGSAYVDKRNYSKAISDYNCAIAINPNFAEAYYNRAVAYLYKQSYEKSWEDVHRAEVLGMKVDPKFLEKLQGASGRKKLNP